MGLGFRDRAASLNPKLWGLGPQLKALTLVSPVPVRGNSEPAGLREKADWTTLKS